MDKESSVRAVCYAVSHIGNSREGQEDNFLIGSGGYLRPDRIERMNADREPLKLLCKLDMGSMLMAVSDGMGGHACGEVASLLTVESLSEHYDEIIDSVRYDKSTFFSHIAAINNTVSSMARQNAACRGMGATLCGFISNGGDILGFNVGDSRLYMMHGGTLRQISVDHTEGRRLLRMNLLTEEEEKNFPRRKMLYRHIGYDGSVKPDLFRITGCEQGSVIMLCSDGLTDALTDAEIGQIIGRAESLQARGDALVSEAVGRNIGHGDNITVILVEF